jgi:hypothetical protein
MEYAGESGLRIEKHHFNFHPKRAKIKAQSRPGPELFFGLPVADFAINAVQNYLLAVSVKKKALIRNWA